jgi:GAF domain-containing protein
VVKVDDIKKRNAALDDNLTKIRKLRSVISIPLFSASGVVGVILLGSVKPKAFTKGHVRILSIIGRQLGLVIASASVHKRLDWFIDENL